MTKSKTFGTWLKTHIRRNDSLGTLAAQFYSFKYLQDYWRENGHPEIRSFYLKDIKKPSQIYKMIKTYSFFFRPPERYERVAYLAAKQYSRYCRDLAVRFESFDPYTEQELKKAVREIGA